MAPVSVGEATSLAEAPTKRHWARWHSENGRRPGPPRQRLGTKSPASEEDSTTGADQLETNNEHWVPITAMNRARDLALTCLLRLLPPLELSLVQGFTCCF